MTALTIASAVSFVAVTLISLCLGERVFPFSTLGMFAYPYRPHIVVLVRDTDDNSVAPAAVLLGATTSGLSQEVATRIDRGELPQAIVDDLRRRLHATTSRGDRFEFLIWKVTVDSAAKVHTEPVVQSAAGCPMVGTQDEYTARPSMNMA